MTHGIPTEIKDLPGGGWAVKGNVPDEVIEKFGRTEHIAKVCLGGSHAYGTNREGSDMDWRGVFIASTYDHFKLITPRESVTSNEPDLAAFELRKFCKLAAAANPNVLEILFTPALYLSTEGLILEQNRDAFLSRRALKTYGGYAVAQLKKAKAGTGGSRGREHFKREKFVLHLLRLMEQGINLLETGTLDVAVMEPDVLWERAKRPLHEIEVEFNGLDRRMRDAAMKSPLPEEPDLEKIDRLLVAMRVRAMTPQPFDG